MEQKKMNWVVASFLSMFSFAIMILILRKVTELKLMPEVVNFYFFLFTAIGFLCFVLLRRAPLTLSAGALPFFILVAAVAVAANFYSITAIAAAPNPGYVRGIEALSAAVITLAALYLFGAEINSLKLVGIGFSVVGVILISL